MILPLRKQNPQLTVKKKPSARHSSYQNLKEKRHSYFYCCRDSMKANEEVGKEVLAELRERAQQPEADKVNIRIHIFP